ncbi:hypothetical protein IDH44_13625 [Paenibacillus sp. IB182496]|uniref:Uncharacterized protein n=1 Tax=Paenibacillus sabuli TaxID=2772509 RepID=A0A927GSF7_9BACL|nr:hypothetical protein [Paenibacillus sabuli]MBD2846241.1 hypothetical protein [Paenibacillus sabuli]
MKVRFALCALILLAGYAGWTAQAARDAGNASASVTDRVYTQGPQSVIGEVYEPLEKESLGDPQRSSDPRRLPPLEEE